MKPKEYMTDRLRLSVADESDENRITEYVVRNRAFLAAWEPSRSPDYYTPNRQKELIQFDQECMEQGQLFKVWLSPLLQPELIIGSVALSNIVRGAFLSCHMGYRLDEKWLNKGYMTEALEKVVSVAWHELGLHRIEANIMPRNAASLRLTEKLGFQREGLARQYLKINGKWEDHVHMTILNEDMD
ncbi:GNAT family N-acetyltransferase [Cohnella boryungensis]|uniref:GNAT family N-acetyltransferase n=1 Tax=Cohnella boryungensis TaxID=768479 RepID=A0ABV8SI64_9BACL